jgi:hypothetical protein
VRPIPPPRSATFLTLLGSFVLLTLAVPFAARPKFVDTYKAPGAETVGYAGKKVVGLIISDDMPLRMSTEEALARELNANGVNGMAAYRVIPLPETRDAERARDWFQKTGVAGVVVMRLVDVAKETTPTAVVWSSGAYYSSLWSYYPYAWTTSAVAIGPGRTDTTYVVETLVFDVGSNKLLWAGTSQSTNPDDAQKLVKDLVNEAAYRMKKDGLMRKKP